MISGFRPSLGFLSGVAGASVFVAASTDNISLLELCGSPGSPGTYTVTINAGVVIGTSSTGIAAVVTGTFPTGSIVNLINKGNIYGKEGVAGIGAPGPNSASGTAGSPAGPAVR